MLYAKGLYNAAIDDYSTAIEINSDYMLAYLNRGVALAEKGDTERALADYDRAITLNPKNATAYFNRGIVRALLDEMDGAIEDYTQALTLRPDMLEARLNRGYARAARGMTKPQNIEMLTEALEDLRTYRDQGKPSDEEYQELSGLISDLERKIR
jgi:tetratricopeptide (TPR) repeat protein